MSESKFYLSQFALESLHNKPDPLVWFPNYFNFKICLVLLILETVFEFILVVSAFLVVVGLSFY